MATIYRPSIEGWIDGKSDEPRQWLAVRRAVADSSRLGGAVESLSLVQPPPIGGRKTAMDPEQLQILLGYTAFVSVASLILRRAKPEWTRTRIALIAGGLPPLLGVGLGVLAVVRWINAAPLPGDTDHHAMGIIGIAILLILSLVCLVVGIIVSLVVTTIVRVR